MSGIILPHIAVTTNGKDYTTDPVSYDLVKHRTIYLNGQVTPESSLSTITQLSYLNDKSDKDVYLMINSPGGSVSDGMAIHDYIKYRMDCDVNTVATGVAASMGAFLLAAGTKGKRFASPSAEIMIHQPLGGIQGQATDISLVAEHIQNVKKRMAEAMAKECSKSPEEVIRDMERDYWLTSEEAVAYGLVDHVGYPDIR